MKLLFVSNLFPSADDPVRGLDNAVLLSHLASEGVEVRVLAIRPTLRPDRWRTSEAWQPRPEEADVPVTYIGAPYVPKVGSRWNHRLMRDVLRRPLEREIDAFTPDVVLCSWLYPDGCAVSELTVPRGIPTALICQGSDAHTYLNDRIRKHLIVSAVSRSAATVTRSKELARLLGEAGAPPEKLHPIYNGVDPTEFHPPEDPGRAKEALGFDPERPLALFVGNFLPVKNPELLLEALRRLQQRSDRVAQTHLCLIGSGPLEPQLRKTIAEMGLGNAVTFAGRRRSDEVADYMRAADVLCLPSWNEGVPNVILEAVSSGLPVVASAVGGISEIIDTELLGTLVPPGESRRFASAVARVLEEAVNRPRPADSNSLYSWKSTSSSYQELLEQVAVPREQTMEFDA